MVQFDEDLDLCLCMKYDIALKYYYKLYINQPVESSDARGYTLAILIERSVDISQIDVTETVTTMDFRVSYCGDLAQLQTILDEDNRRML